MGRAGGAVAALACAFLVLTTPPASASKSWPDLVVSRDGTVWQGELDHPLYPPGLRLVPGDTTSRVLYARNQSGQDARLRVRVRVADASRWLASGQLRMAVSVNGVWRMVRVRGTTGVGRFSLAPGDVVPVRVRFRLLGPAAAQAMGRKLGFSVNLRLTELPGKTLVTRETTP